MCCLLQELLVQVLALEPVLLALGPELEQELLPGRGCWRCLAVTRNRAVIIYSFKLYFILFSVKCGCVFHLLNLPFIPNGGHLFNFFYVHDFKLFRR